MNLLCRTIGVVLFTVAGVFAVNGQQPTASPTPTITCFRRRRSGLSVCERYGWTNETAENGGIGRYPAVAGFTGGVGQGAKGYGRRFASGMGRNAIRQTVTYGLDSALGQDTGFKRSKREGFFPRLKDALAENVTSRTKSGNRGDLCTALVGIYTGSIVASETWYPERYSYKDGLRREPPRW